MVGFQEWDHARVVVSALCAVGVNGVMQLKRAGWMRLTRLGPQV